MPLITDIELHSELAQNPNYISGLNISDWQGKDSPIQPCSVDLHIGDMFLPGEARGKTPDALTARSEVTLSTGHTAVILTREVLNFPRNWAAYGFPPSHVSSHGLLVTNPGHIDPGYHGNLRFTVINMSAEPFQLRTGDAIVTLLIDKLSSEVGCDFQQRTGRPLAAPSWADVNRLSKDFVNVEVRAKRIARKEGIKWTAVVTLVGAIFTGVIAHIHDSGVDDLKAKVAVLEERINTLKMDGRLTDLEKKVEATRAESRLADLETKVNKKK
ncbi:MAG TPA: hypothetical protein VHC90_10485 [Bryobacteraceae bacterium]|nr:hypothetical protein [Bryobacteraceae bacterium]